MKNKTAKNQRGIIKPLIIIVIILVVVVLAIGGYFIYKQYFSPKNQANNSQNSAVGGRIYSNNKYGFLIKHPSALAVNSAINNNILIVRFQSAANVYPIWLYVGSKDDKAIVDAINPAASDTHTVKKASMASNSIGWNTIEEKDTPAGGLSMPATSYSVYTTKGEYTYFLRCVNCDSEIFGASAGQMRTLFDKMVSTFQFTK